MGQRHFGFAELRHYCFAPTNRVAAKLNCPDLCKVEMSGSSVRCVMWESMYSIDFQGLWEAWDSFIVPRFPSDRHFHRF
jgi:hypothetical protein